jgi:hypothetical protein
MHPNCIAEISHVLGRNITEDEAARVESAVLNAGRELARQDPEGWRGMPDPERVRRSAERAEQAAVERADKTAQRRAASLLIQTREAAHLMERAPEMRAEHKHNAAVFERFRQVENRIAGERGALVSDVMEAVYAVEPSFFRLIENPAAVRDFAREVYGEPTGNAKAARAAKKWVEEMEIQRIRANEAGADIAKLEDWRMPQQHDVGMIARAGKEEWTNFIEPLLDRRRYLNEDGSLMSDPEFHQAIEGAYDTLSTEGRNKLVPGQDVHGSRASQFDDAHRFIHFRNADSYLEYLAKFGRDSMLDAMQGHVQMMAKNIALMEEFGPNPNATFRLLKDMAEKADNVAGAREALSTLQTVWDTLNGTTAQPVDAALATKWQKRRNFVTATRLGSVLLTSVTDVATMMAAARYNGVSAIETFANVVKSFGGETTEMATRLGLAIDSVTNEMAQWHADTFAHDWTSKLANTTMRLGGVEKWTHALRRGFSITLSSTLGKMRETDWHALSPFDRERFTASGVREQDWKIWQLAELTDATGEGRPGAMLLTKDGIRAIPDDRIIALGLDPVRDVNTAVAKLLGHIDQEAKYAVMAPDLMTRAAITQGTRAGTHVGEQLRNLALFKSYPMAMVIKQMRRLNTLPNGTAKAVYSARLAISLSMWGAVALQLHQLKDGKDPRDMTETKFWAAAFVQGGGIGIFGDVLYTGLGGNSRGGQPNWTGMAGPVFGVGLDAFSVANEFRKEAIGEDAKAGAKLLRFAKSNAPFINLWYTRAAFDHLLFHDLQEQISPGYLQDMERRAQRDFGQSYWWRPGGSPVPGLNEAEQPFAPERAPDFEAAVGTEAPE